MRTSQAESIRKPLEQAIKALNDFFEHEKKSEESEADFEKEYQRLAALPEGTAPATKLETLTRNQLEQDVTAMLGPAPRNNPASIESNPGINYEEAIKNYLARKEALLRPHITLPRIKDYYPWRHCVEEAAGHLARCGWTVESDAIDTELGGLPKDNGSIDWTQPATLQEIRDEVSEVAHRIRDILTACFREMAQTKRSSTDSKPKDRRGAVAEAKAKKKEVEKKLCVAWEKFRDRKGGTKEDFLKNDPEAENLIRDYFREEIKRKKIDVLTMLMRIIERNRN